jgi:LPS export ABC transporter protein LptC/lipopolysaccharide transport protein LptA
MIREKIPAIGRIASLLLLVGAIVVIVTAFIRARRQAPPIGFEKGPPVLAGKVTSIIEDYKYVKTEEGREKFRMLAAKDIAYEDGRHELEKIDLTVFLGKEEGRSMRVVADRGATLRDQSQVTFAGNVRVTSSDGLEVTTESLTYEQASGLARTEAPIQFRRGALSGSSVGASLHSKEDILILPHTPIIASADYDPNKKGAQPVEIRGDRATYSGKEGWARFEGNVNLTQGERQARADAAVGFANPQTRKIERVEMRGNSMLKSQEKGKASEAQSRDMDFFFDEERRLKHSAIYGAARARSLEPDSPREIVAERIDIAYRPNETGSDIQAIATQGRTVMKLEAIPNSTKESEWSERVIEADAVHSHFHEDGKNLARAEANGNAVLTGRCARPDSQLCSSRPDPRSKLSSPRRTPSPNSIRCSPASGRKIKLLND